MSRILQIRTMAVSLSEYRILSTPTSVPLTALSSRLARSVGQASTPATTEYHIRMYLFERDRTGTYLRGTTPTPVPLYPSFFSSRAVRRPSVMPSDEDRI